jgi:hypothetical protein
MMKPSILLTSLKQDRLAAPKSAADGMALRVKPFAQRTSTIRQNHEDTSLNSDDAGAGRRF